MDLIYMLSSTVQATEVCNNPGTISIMTVIGYVMLAIKIIAPVTLIVVGMIDMTKAIAGKDEDTIKKAQKALGKKAIAAVCVFLIVTMVGLIMTLVGDVNYRECAKCLNNPTLDECSISGQI